MVAFGNVEALPLARARMLSFSVVNYRELTMNLV